MKIILIGVQGSGKSTQGNLLSKKLSVPYVSMGSIFRDIASKDSSLGREIKNTMNEGFLIPDEKTIEVLRDYLSSPEYSSGYILDGFPRTVVQAKAFESGIDRAVYLELSDEIALKRISERSEKRDDETPGAIKKRIDSFHKFTEPVLHHLEDKGILIRVDGEQSVEKIHQHIIKELGIA